MSTTLFLALNYADLATVAASSQASGSLAAANVLDQRRSRIWRSGSGTTSYLNLTRNSSEPVNYASVVDVNLRPTGSIRVQSWADALDGASPGADVTVSPATRTEDVANVGFGAGGFGAGGFGGVSAHRPVKGNVTLIPLGDDYTDDYWRYTFTDAASSYQECGRIFLSSKLVFNVDPITGWGMNPTELGQSLETIGGQRYWQPVNSRRVFSGSFDFMSDQEVSDFLRSRDVLGAMTPLIFSFYADNAEKRRPFTIYGTYNELSTSGKSVDLNNLRFEIAEDL